MHVNKSKFSFAVKGNTNSPLYFNTVSSHKELENVKIFILYISPFNTISFKQQKRRSRKKNPLKNTNKFPTFPRSSPSFSSPSISPPTPISYPLPSLPTPLSPPASIPHHVFPPSPFPSTPHPLSSPTLDSRPPFYSSPPLILSSPLVDSSILTPSLYCLRTTLRVAAIRRAGSVLIVGATERDSLNSARPG